MTRPDSAHGQGCGHQQEQVMGGSGEGGGRTTMVRSCSIGPSEEAADPRGDKSLPKTEKK